MNTYLHHNQQVETFTLPRKNDNPLKFEGKLIGESGTCEIARDTDNIFGSEFNLRTTLRLFETAAGKFVASVKEWDDTNRQVGLRDAVFADTPEKLFEAVTRLRSQFLREGYINTSAVDGDTLRELFLNAGLSSEIPASAEHVDEIE